MKLLNQSYSLIRLLIERMTPMPLTIIVVVGLLISSGMAWRLGVADWIDINAGDAEKDDKNASDGNEAEPGEGGATVAPSPEP